MLRTTFRSALHGAAQLLVAIVALAAGMAAVTYLLPGAASLLFAFPALLTAKELREKRANLFTQAQGILDKAKEEKRELTDEERTNFDKCHDDIDTLGKEARRIERHEEAQRELEGSRGVRAGRQDMRGDQLPGAGDGNEPADEERARQDEAAFRAWLSQGMLGLTPEHHDVMQRRFQQLDTEARALATGAGAAGGYTVPEGFETRLEEALLAFGGMMEAAEVIPTTDGAPFPWPTADDTGNTGVRVGENTKVPGDDGSADPEFGQVMIESHMYSSGIVKVPIQLLQDNAVGLEGRLVGWLATRIGRKTNAEFTTNDPGTPTNNGGPKGLLVGAPLGHTTASATAITYEDLVALEHSIDPAHRRAPGVRWMFHDQLLRTLKTLKDEDGRPLWLPGVAVREPDTILGYRYVINQDMPTPAASAKAIVFGDLKKYKIRVVRGVAMLRLAERYAENLQVGFLAFQRFDGKLVDAGSKPVKRLQFAASGG